jgi:phosphoglycolate phosphatase
VSPPAHSFRLIVFDVDGTLVDSQHAIMAVMAAAFAAEGLPAPALAAVRQQVGLGIEETMARLLPEAEEALHRRLSQGFREAAYALRSTRGFAEPLYPGIREALDGLRHPEVFLAIATGKARRGLDHTLSSHSLTALFHSLQTVDSNPSKPHPAMLLNAMAEVGVEPSETVFIGDSVFDMAMAANARTAALGVAWGYHDPEDLRAAGAGRIIQSPGELGPTLAEMGVR